MSRVTTHVLDLSSGRPAVGIAVALEVEESAGSVREFREIGSGVTDEDGRLRSLVPAGTAIPAGIFRIRFGSGAYFDRQGVETFYPEVSVLFRICDDARDHHVPLLLSPYGYSTYRGT